MRINMVCADHNVFCVVNKGMFTRQQCTKNWKFFPLRFFFFLTTLSKRSSFTRIREND